MATGYIGESPSEKSSAVQMASWIGIFATVGLAGLVTFSPSRAMSNPPVESSHTLEHALAPPESIRSMLARSCNDCHSAETRWPWYARMPVVSWALASDVERG